MNDEHRPADRNQVPANFDETLLSAYLDGELSEESKKEVEFAIHSFPILNDTLEDLRQVRTLVQMSPVFISPTAVLLGEWNRQIPLEFGTHPHETPTTSKLQQRVWQEDHNSARPIISTRKWMGILSLAAGLLVLATTLFLLPNAGENSITTVAMKQGSSSEPVTSELKNAESNSSLSSQKTAPLVTESLPSQAAATTESFSVQENSQSIPSAASSVPLLKSEKRMATRNLVDNSPSIPTVRIQVKKLSLPSMGSTFAAGVEQRDAPAASQNSSEAPSNALDYNFTERPASESSAEVSGARLEENFHPKRSVNELSLQIQGLKLEDKQLEIVVQRFQIDEVLVKNGLERVQPAESPTDPKPAADSDSSARRSTPKLENGSPEDLINLVIEIIP